MASSSRQPTRTRGLVETSREPGEWSSQQLAHVFIAVGLPVVLVGTAIVALVGGIDIGSLFDRDDTAALPFVDESAAPLEAAETTTPTTSTTTTTAVQRGPTTTPAPELEPGQIGAGTHEVGVDIAPGLYRVSIAWARLDENRDVIDNDLTLKGVTLMRVFDTDAYVDLTGDAMSVDLVPPFDPIAMGFTQGTYLVGTDVAPGRCRVSAEPGATAFVARLDDTFATLEVAQNDESVEVEVLSSDFAVRFTGALEQIDANATG